MCFLNRVLGSSVQQRAAWSLGLNAEEAGSCGAASNLLFGGLAHGLYGQLQAQRDEGVLTDAQLEAGRAEAARELLADTEGIFTEPAGGTTIAVTNPNRASTTIISSKVKPA